MPNFSKHRFFKDEVSYHITYCIFSLLHNLKVISYLGNGMMNGIKSIRTDPED